MLLRSLAPSRSWEVENMSMSVERSEVWSGEAPVVWETVEKVGLNVKRIESICLNSFSKSEASKPQCKED